MKSPDTDQTPAPEAPSPPAASPGEPTLASLRDEIDRLDAAIHGLLIERGAIIDRLIQVKRTAETGSAFRPAREADVVRRLVERHRGRLPAEMIVHIWRQIISTFTHIQSPHVVHVAVGPESGGARELARYHFGFGVPLVKHSGPASVIEAVRRERVDLGFLPLGEAASPWWEALGAEGAPVIMAIAPIMAPAAHPSPLRAAVIADAGIDTASLPYRCVSAVIAAPPADPVALGARGLLAHAPGERGAHVLVWGPREDADAAIVTAATGAAPLDAPRPVGYAAAPILI